MVDNELEEVASERSGGYSNIASLSDVSAVLYSSVAVREPASRSGFSLKGLRKTILCDVKIQERQTQLEASVNDELHRMAYLSGSYIMVIVSTAKISYASRLFLDGEFTRR